MLTVQRYPYAVERAVTMLGADELRSILSHAVAAGVTLSDAAAAAAAVSASASTSTASSAIATAAGGVFGGGSLSLSGYGVSGASARAWWNTTVFLFQTAKHVAS